MQCIPRGTQPTLLTDWTKCLTTHSRSQITYIHRLDQMVNNHLHPIHLLHLEPESTEQTFLLLRYFLLIKSTVQLWRPGGKGKHCNYKNRYEGVMCIRKWPLTKMVVIIGRKEMRDRLITPPHILQSLAWFPTDYRFFFLVSSLSLTLFSHLCLVCENNTIISVHCHLSPPPPSLVSHFSSIHFFISYLSLSFSHFLHLISRMCTLCLESVYEHDVLVLLLLLFLSTPILWDGPRLLFSRLVCEWLREMG